MEVPHPAVPKRCERLNAEDCRSNHSLGSAAEIFTSNAQEQVSLSNVSMFGESSKDSFFNILIADSIHARELSNASKSVGASSIKTAAKESSGVALVAVTSYLPTKQSHGGRSFSGLLQEKDKSTTTAVRDGVQSSSAAIKPPAVSLGSAKETVADAASESNDEDSRKLSPGPKGRESTSPKSKSGVKDGEHKTSSLVSDLESGMSLNDQLSSFCTDDGEKRIQGTWSAEENNMFFDLLRTYGRSFNEIKDRMQGRKTREQIRCYYYRIVKKINQIISITGAKIDKFSGSEGKTVVQAMLAWWELVRKGNVDDTSVNLFRISTGLDDETRRKFANELWKKSAITLENLPDSRKYPIDTLEILLHPSKDAPKKNAEDATPLANVNEMPSEKGFMEVKQVHNQPAQGKEAASAAGPRPRPAGGSLPPGFESHKTPERENPLSVDCGTPLPVRFNLRLIPQYTDLSLLMTRCGLNPQLELTLKPSKSIGRVAQRLCEKWSEIVGQEIAKMNHLAGKHLSMELSNPVFRVRCLQRPDHVGWTPKDLQIATGEVFQFIGCPSNFRLHYSIDNLHPGMLCFNQIFVSGDRSAIPDEERNEVERNKSSILDGESSSSSSSDFVPFQNIKSILSTENSTASSQRSLSGEDSNSKGSVTEEAKKRKEVDLHCDEELELADLVASGNSQTFRHVIIDNRSWPAGYLLQEQEIQEHSNSRGQLIAGNFNGDSLDCLQHLLGEDNSLGSLLSSRQGVFPSANSRQALVEKGAEAMLSPLKRALDVQEGGEQEGYSRACKQLKIW